MAQPVLLLDNIKSLAAFSAIVSTPIALTAAENTRNNHRIFSFLGWASLLLGKVANLHNLTHGIWPPILVEKQQLAENGLLNNVSPGLSNFNTQNLSTALPLTG